MLSSQTFKALTIQQMGQLRGGSTDEEENRKAKGSAGDLPSGA